MENESNRKTILVCSTGQPLQRFLIQVLSRYEPRRTTLSHIFEILVVDFLVQPNDRVPRKDGVTFWIRGGTMPKITHRQTECAKNKAAHATKDFTLVKRAECQGIHLLSRSWKAFLTHHIKHWGEGPTRHEAEITEVTQSKQDPWVVTIKVSNNRWCAKINGEHKSNRIYFVVHLRRKFVLQRCFDEEHSNFSSHVTAVQPWDIDDSLFI